MLERVREVLGLGGYVSVVRKRRKRLQRARQLKLELDSYIRRLEEEQTEVEEMLKAQAAKLSIETDKERRLRSIQNILETKPQSGIAPALNELVCTCTDWPAKGVNRFSLGLFLLLREVGRESLPDEGSEVSVPDGEREFAPLFLGE